MLVGVRAEVTEEIAEPAIEQVGDVVVGFIGQHEQRPGKPERSEREREESLIGEVQTKRGKEPLLTF